MNSINTSVATDAVPAQTVCIAGIRARFTLDVSLVVLDGKRKRKGATNLAATPLANATPAKHVTTSCRGRILHILQAQSTLPAHLPGHEPHRLVVV